MYFATLTGGTVISDVLLNGYSQSIQNTNLNFLTALGANPITPYSIPISNGDLVNGTNYLYVVVNVTQGFANKGTGLMINGTLHLDYNTNPANVGVFNTSGSDAGARLYCPAALNVALGTGQVNSNFNLKITGPNNSVIYNGTPPAALSVYPSGNRTYNLTLTNLQCGEVSTLNYYFGTEIGDCYSERLGSPTIIKENQLLDGTSVWPNPSNGNFSINVNASESGVISIYDITGNLIKKIDTNKETFEYKIDLTNLSKGIYMVNVDSKSEHYSKKIILE